MLECYSHNQVKPKDSSRPQFSKRTPESKRNQLKPSVNFGPKAVEHETARPRITGK